jgi:DNA-binding GntR family transcriptional regulator
MVNDVDELSSKTLRDQAYEALENLIITQALAPGSKVTEAELSDQLGIGRTPIREALQRLAREGLVVVMPRKAIVIQTMTLDRLCQLIEVRAAVERLLVVCAVERATLDERAALLQLATVVEEAAEMDGALYLRVVGKLNNKLCEAARNEFLYNLMTSVYALSRQFAFAHNQRVETRRRAASLHARILRAVAAQDKNAAEKASERMMNYLREYANNVKREGEGRGRVQVRNRVRSKEMGRRRGSRASSAGEPDVD